MLEAGRGREKGREKEREARGFVRKGMMYDLSVPRSAVARFSTPSSSRKVRRGQPFLRIDGDAPRKNGL